MHIPDTLRLYAASSFVLASASADATVGASLTFVTVRVNASLTELPPLSVAVTVMTWEPTSAFSGVPEIVPLLMLRELGAPDMV